MQGRQGGFSFIEMIVVTALTTLIGIWAASSWVQQSEDAASASMGVWLLTVKGAVDQMLARQSDVMIGLVLPAVDQQDYVNVWRPTISELVRAGHLTKGFPEHAPLPYDVTIRVQPPKGLCLTQGCKIESLLLITPKVSHSNPAANLQRIGKILETLPGHGASVTMLAPLRIRGPTLDLANPPLEDMSPLPIGSIVLTSFYDSTANGGFLRQGDRRNARLRAGLQVDESISAGGSMSATGRVSSATHLQTGAVATPGEPCDAAGLIAQSSAIGLLVCQSGVWRGGVKSDGGWYVLKIGFPCEAFDFWKLVRVNPETGDCTCPEGYKPHTVAIFKFPYTYSEEEFHTIRCVPDE